MFDAVQKLELSKNNYQKQHAMRYWGIYQAEIFPHSPSLANTKTMS
jgi:hypothetical protein